ncbi:MAG: elongation factor P [Patescibacteria group bacterium]
MLSLNQAKAGTKIIWRAAPHEIVEANHLKVGRGGAKLVTKLRNLLTGSTIDYTFAGDERLEEAEIRYRPSQFLYAQDDKSFLMTNDDYETLEVALPKKQSQFLLEGSTADLIIWQGQAIGVNLPKKVELKVSYTEPGFKGNTQSSTLKPAQLETGLEVMVPLFINAGDIIRVSTETGAYDARV